MLSAGAGRTKSGAAQGWRRSTPRGERALENGLLARLAGAVDGRRGVPVVVLAQDRARGRVRCDDLRSLARGGHAAGDECAANTKDRRCHERRQDDPQLPATLGFLKRPSRFHRIYLVVFVVWPEQRERMVASDALLCHATHIPSDVQHTALI